MKSAVLANLAQLNEFDEIIDVRSPSEFLLDHVPGALNFPVLDDTERVRVGTIYKQISAFDAKKIGAALVSRNIARHLEDSFMSRPRGWKPLVYCWRGGSRSGALTHVLRQIGFNAAQLEGGYKVYRNAVRADLLILPERFDFRVLCGPTGSGKSRFLRALQEAGAQVLDLEGLAAHRGSVLGQFPDTVQPAQKMFDSRLWWTLKHLDPTHPVYVEAESKKIGGLRVPDALLAQMRAGNCVRIEVAKPLRVALLKAEYAHFLAHPGTLRKKLDGLASIYGQKTIEHWNTLAELGDWDELVLALLEKHYDPAYEKSTLKNYPHYADKEPMTIQNLDPAAFLQMALSILKPS